MFRQKFILLLIIVAMSICMAKGQKTITDTKLQAKYVAIRQPASTSKQYSEWKKDSAVIFLMDDNLIRVKDGWANEYFRTLKFEYEEFIDNYKRFSFIAKRIKTEEIGRFIVDFGFRNDSVTPIERVHLIFEDTHVVYIVE